MSLPIKIKHTLRAVFRLVKIFIVLPTNAQSKYEKIAKKKNNNNKKKLGAVVAVITW
jgi:hypothetical protein